jgi:type IV pilus assembly protein PilM
MSILDQLRAFIEDPAPNWVFELSAAGLAWGLRAPSRKQAPAIRFTPLEPGVLNISPAQDNVADPEALAAAVTEVASSAPPARRRRDAALILPDYCARVAVLDFESFPKETEEQLALVRFRMKKAVPFDVDAAAVSFDVQRSSGKKVEVVVAAAAQEIVARYEAPFRAAGFSPGYLTTATLAMLDLLPPAGLNVALKLCERVMSVAVCRGRDLKLVRSVEIPDLTLDDVMAVLYPTLAYAEDELGQKADRILACGLGSGLEELRAHCEAELGITVEPLRSIWGAVNEANAGLVGWLQAQEAS